jgi:pimeloyl-ACP methyl ester carboxylesterase
MKLAANGIELSWDGIGEGAPLLWLHGFMGYGADWPHVFGEVPAAYRLIAPDLPGHGASTGRPGPYSFRAAADDIVALLDHLGVDRVPLVGLSGGGIVALHLAVAHPGRVSRMAIVSAPPRFPEQARAIQRRFSETMLPPDEQARMRQRHRRPGQIAALVEQTRAFAGGTDPDFTRAQLERISADTLIVFGDRDPLYPVSAALELRQAIPRSWLWVVPNGGHGPIFGAMAPHFRDTALRFLKGEWA